MKTNTARKISLLIGGLLLVSLAGLVCVVYVFVSMYQRDMRSLNGFVETYHAFDQAAAAASTSVFNEDGQDPAAMEENFIQLEAALADLKTTAAGQISSLIKNEDEAMRTMQNIAALSEQEVNALKAYLAAPGDDAERSALEQAVRALTLERQEAFDHFQDLGR